MTNSFSPPKKEAPQNDRLQQYIERRDAYNLIELSVVLSKLGAIPNQDGDSSKWKIGMGNIIVKGQSWKNVNTNVHKGFGGVQLVQHALDLERQPEAMKWFEENFGEAAKLSPSIKSTQTEGSRKPKEEFEQPPSMEHLWPQVRSYLTATTGLPGHFRCIPASIVDELHEGGTLYASRAYHNIEKRFFGEPRAVFLGPLSAELREVVPGGFKGTYDNSDPEVSGFQVPASEEVAERILALQEAGVTSLSYRALFPGRFSFSTNGAGRFSLQYRLTLEGIEAQHGVRLAHDADKAGDVGAQHVFNALFVRLLLSRRLDIDPETIDEWLLSGKIDVTPTPSPHEMFFNTTWQTSFDVYEHEIVKNGDQVKDSWVFKGGSAPPTVRLAVKKSDLHPRLPRGTHDILVAEKSFRYITEILNVKRDRPIHGNDWNDELVALGSSYTMMYEREAKKDFADGVPELPEHLRHLMTPGVKVVSSPKPAAPPISNQRVQSLNNAVDAVKMEEPAPVRPLSRPLSFP